ncbi:hypothetical protein HDV00_007232 [Rhizophlyctis rosea]|nr:hypothetical protein HDV00_007232 [Rhizophlyctis rosea]
MVPVRLYDHILSGAVELITAGLLYVQFGTGEYRDDQKMSLAIDALVKNLRAGLVQLDLLTNPTAPSPGPAETALQPREQTSDWMVIKTAMAKRRILGTILIKSADDGRDLPGQATTTPPCGHAIFKDIEAILGFGEEHKNWQVDF